MKLKILSLIALLAGAATGAQAEGQLKIGTEGAYPPWSMADANGNVTGFDADVGALLCAKLDKECVFVVQAFDGLIPALQANQFDVIISGMSITQERKKQIAFSVGYAEFPNRFVVRKDSDLVAISDIPALLTALEGKKIGAQAATTHANFIAKLIPGADLRTYDTLDQQWIDLSSGRIDAAFADATADQDFLNKPEGADFAMAEAVIASAYDATLGEGIGVGMAQDNTELKAQIDTALCELIADGSITKASEKWFKIDLSRPCQ